MVRLSVIICAIFVHAVVGQVQVFPLVPIDDAKPNVSNSTTEAVSTSTTVSSTSTSSASTIILSTSITSGSAIDNTTSGTTNSSTIQEDSTTTATQEPTTNTTINSTIISDNSGNETLINSTISIGNGTNETVSTIGATEASSTFSTTAAESTSAVPTIPGLRSFTQAPVEPLKGRYIKTTSPQKTCKQHSDCYGMREPDEWCPIPSSVKYLEKGCFCDYSRNICTIQRLAEKGEEFADCAEKQNSACLGISKSDNLRRKQIKQ